jgi:hypothetical protein
MHYYYNLYIFGLYIKTKISVSRLWYEIDIEDLMLF